MLIFKPAFQSLVFLVSSLFYNVTSSRTLGYVFFQDLVDELRRQRVLEERLPAAGDPRRPVLQRVLLQKRQSIEASLDQVKISQTTIFVDKAKKIDPFTSFIVLVIVCRGVQGGSCPILWPAKNSMILDFKVLFR